MVAATAQSPAAEVAAEYRAFARQEAHGRSAAYESLAESVAGDAALVRFVCSLPPAKRQPNLLFAAARYLLGAPPGLAQLRDLLTDLPTLAAQAPAGATLVVYHTSVLSYVAPGERGRFFPAGAGLRAVWLSNEAPGVVPGIASAAREQSTALLVRDGRTPLAHTDPHGTWLRWLG